MYPLNRNWSRGKTHVSSRVKSKATSSSSWGYGAYSDKVRTSHVGYKTGFGIPQFHAKKRRGDLLPMTPFTRFESDSRIDRNTFYAVENDGGVVTYDANEAVNPSGWELTEADVAALVPPVDLHAFVSAAAANIVATGFDTLTFAAELRKTYDMVRNLGSSVEKHVRMGRLDRLWLEFRYGWRPFYYEMESLRSAIIEFDEKRQRYSERAGTSYPISETLDIGSYTVTQAGELHRYLTTGSASVRGSVVADIKVHRFRADPLNTSWELVPYSFVVDWFIGVGNWLNQAAFLASTSNYVAATGALIEVTRVGSYVPGSMTAGWSSLSRDFSSTSHASYSFRTPTTLPPLPVKNVNLSWAKLIDLTSLITARAYKGPVKFKGAK